MKKFSLQPQAITWPLLPAIAARIIAALSLQPQAITWPLLPKKTAIEKDLTIRCSPKRSLGHYCKRWVFL